MYDERLSTDLFHVEYVVQCCALRVYFVEVPERMKRDCPQIYSMYHYDGLYLNVKTWKMRFCVRGGRLEKRLVSHLEPCLEFPTVIKIDLWPFSQCVI